MKNLQTKNLTKRDAIEIANVVMTALLDNDLCVTLMHKRLSKTITILSVKSCDAAASLFSNFELNFKNGAKYAEMVINYD